MTAYSITVGLCPGASRATLNALWDAMGKGGPFHTAVVAAAAPDDPNEAATHWCFQGSDTDADIDMFRQMAKGLAMPTLPEGVEYGVNGVPSLVDATAAAMTIGIYTAEGNVQEGYGAASQLAALGKKIRATGGL